MRYTIAQYAQALINAINDASQNEIKTIARTMVRLLRQKKQGAKLPAILREARHRYFYKNGITTIDIISAVPLLPAARENIRRIMGAHARVHEVVRPEAIAGIKIIVNDAYRIDATAAGIMQKLFVTHEHYS